MCISLGTRCHALSVFSWRFLNVRHGLRRRHGQETTHLSSLFAREVDGIYVDSTGPAKTRLYDARACVSPYCLSSHSVADTRTSPSLSARTDHRIANFSSYLRERRQNSTRPKTVAAAAAATGDMSFGSGGRRCGHAIRNVSFFFSSFLLFLNALTIVSERVCVCV